MLVCAGAQIFSPYCTYSWISAQTRVITLKFITDLHTTLMVVVVLLAHKVENFAHNTTCHRTHWLLATSMQDPGPYEREFECQQDNLEKDAMNPRRPGK